MIHCEHLGEDTGTTAAVDLCCGDGEQIVYRCKSRTCNVVATGRPFDPSVGTCFACPVRQQPLSFPVLQPTAYQEIGLPAKAKKEGAYNCSLHVDDRPGFAFAYRAKWQSSDIRLGRLNDSYRTVGALMPTLAMHERSPRGREDPRLFQFRGKWHVSYTGYEGKDKFCSVLYARVNPWPFFEQVFHPQYSRRNHAEKNWGFFDCDGELHAVYSIGPGDHRVLKIDGERIVGEHSTEWHPAWAWGVMRGGASPIRVGDEYYSWFHGVLIRPGIRQYTVGLYTFEAKPPFRPMRIVSEPLVIGGFSHYAANEAKSIVFPCGAALKGGQWHISAGEHDAKCSVFAFDAGEIERHLHPVRCKLFRAGELSTVLSLNGWCDESKADKISQLVAAIPEPVNGIEIGVFAGRSLFAAAIGARANPHGGRVVGIDSYDAEENLKGVDTPEHRSHWTRAVVEDARASMRATREKLGLTAYCSVIERTSQAVFPMVQDESLNYLHIDGNHSKNGATFDAETYIPLVKIGGLVLVDDTDPRGKPEFLAGVLDAVAIVEESCDLIQDHGNWRAYRKVR